MYLRVLISRGQQKNRIRSVVVTTMVAVAEGMKRGAKDTRAVMPGNRQKSQGKYNPRTLDR